jgi:nitrate/TMAO reductase-like tetraheme cytochrome c subunit
MPNLEIDSIEQLLKIAALCCAAVSTAVILWYLIRRPPLGRITKSLLLLGLGVMPLGVALTGNISGYEYTLKRPFCGSCHVMNQYLRDAEDPKSTSLAAIHSRNKLFGGESCYTCHADYKIFGAVTTKMNGMRHLYHYVAEYANTGPNGEGGPAIHLYKPFSNKTCVRCHSTSAPRWGGVAEHQGMLEEIRSGQQSCIDCHSEVHPTALSRRKQAEAKAEEKKP